MPGRAAHRAEKFTRAHVRRTGAGGQDAASPQMRDAGVRQSSVSQNGSRAFGLSFCQRRRVENDKIKLSVAVLSKPLERVGLDRFMTAVGERCGVIQSKIALCRFKRVCADLEVSDRGCSAARRVNRKAAGETERVQHVTSSGERFDDAAVLALVEKEAGLLSAQHVRFETQTGFQKSRTGVPPVSEQKGSVFLSKNLSRHVLNVPAQPQHDSFGLQLSAE